MNLKTMALAALLFGATAAPAAAQFPSGGGPIIVSDPPSGRRR